MLHLIFKPALIALALLLLLMGLVLLPLPVPFSFIPMIIGLALLVMVSSTARQKVHVLRRRYPALDRAVRKVEKYLPKGLRKALSTPYGDRPPD